ncbi:MAG TPA: DNRLRE domain-containing protein [Candidatus Saccharimonadales bacterium]|nr:DNRLRE domain-containing protein [Candidatus Saccharimonadales bacterium]
MRKWKQSLNLVMAVLALLLMPTVASAATPQTSSPHYQVNEAFFGSGGELHACSGQYCAKQSAGEFAVGNTKATVKTATLNPIADAYVNSNSGNKDTNYGSDNPLQTSSAANHAYLKFDTSAVHQSATIVSVTLKLYSNITDQGSFQVHTTTDGWTESGITWNNAPAMDPNIIGTSLYVNSGMVSSINLPASAITTDGNTNLVIDYSKAGTIGKFASREDPTAANRPQLVVTYGGYQAQAGFNTDRYPSLTFIVNGTSTNLGVLTAGVPATATGTFSVKSYLASGYAVVTAADPPKSGTYTLKALPNPTALDTGQEQFGINLVANTTPATLSGPSKNPVQVPDSSFSFGQAAQGYDTPNQFKYAKGDVIAQSFKSSGQTNYTISYLFNITPVTPAGVYRIDDVLVATSTF